MLSSERKARAMSTTTLGAISACPELRSFEPRRRVSSEAGATHPRRSAGRPSAQTSLGRLGLPLAW
jgi:hypothetical protein